MKPTTVLVPIPQTHPPRTAAQVLLQRQAARDALAICAERCGAPQTGWEKNANNVPQPLDGFHWSVSHKRQWAVAVIADRPVGIDIEHIAPRPRTLFDALAGADEWRLMGGRTWHDFFRLWTAKEATLKANGVGIAGLGDCRLSEVLTDTHMTLEFRDRTWRIEQFFHDDHVAAVTYEAQPPAWHVADESRGSHPKSAQPEPSGALHP